MNKLHVTKGSAKMEGIFSINTPTSENPFCKMMAKTDSVCKHCYASRFEGFRKNLVPAFKRNIGLLLDKDYIPELLNFKIIRLHSYGELFGYVHFASFVKLAFFNKNTTFTLWTKRKNIVQNYLRKGGIIPSNLFLVYSNPVLDNELKRVPKGFNKVFNVFTKEGAKKVSINCGSKKCMDCRLCYSKNSVSVINEHKKQEVYKSKVYGFWLSF